MSVSSAHACSSVMSDTQSERQAGTCAITTGGGSLTEHRRRACGNWYAEAPYRRCRRPVVRVFQRAVSSPLGFLGALDPPVPFLQTFRHEMLYPLELPVRDLGAGFNRKEKGRLITVCALQGQELSTVAKRHID